MNENEPRSPAPVTPPVIDYHVPGPPGLPGIASEKRPRRRIVAALFSAGMAFVFGLLTLACLQVMVNYVRYTESPTFLGATGYVAMACVPGVIAYILVVIAWDYFSLTPEELPEAPSPNSSGVESDSAKE